MGGGGGISCILSIPVSNITEDFPSRYPVLSDLDMLYSSTYTLF